MSREDNVDADAIAPPDDDLGLDIAALEEELAAEFGDSTEEPEPKPATPPPEPKPEREEIIPVPLAHERKPKKEDLIASIIRMAPLVDGYEQLAISSYRRMRVADLQGELAKIQNAGIEQYTGGAPEPEEGKPEESEEDKKQRIANNIAISDKFVAKSMFAMHQTICQFLEIGSVKLETKTGTNLVGLVDDSAKNRETLEEALVDIFQENKEWLAPLLNPTNRYLFCMSTMCVNRAFENKKNAPPREELPGHSEE